MIYGIFHKGSGLGNQLHRYVATRIKALELGVDFGMVAPELFKGSSFMNLDMGDMKVDKSCYYIENPTGKVIVNLGMKKWEEWDKYTYDPDWNFIEDNTIIDGSFEDERYFEHRLPEIKEWLKVRDDAIIDHGEFTDKHCVIGFRGGEYYTLPELGLPQEYYDRAIKVMEDKGVTRFFVVTDDPELAKQFFPNFQITHDIAHDWNAIRTCPNAIIANSSFYVLPRLLNGGLTIAPRYFNRYNTKKWDYPQFYYKSFEYI